MIHLQIYENAGKCWWKDGLAHRVNGPAARWPNGDQEWYKNGKRHNTNGPAVIYSDGTFEFRINGREISEYELLFLSNQVTAI